MSSMSSSSFLFGLRKKLSTRPRFRSREVLHKEGRKGEREREGGREREGEREGEREQGRGRERAREVTSVTLGREEGKNRIEGDRARATGREGGVADRDRRRAHPGAGRQPMGAVHT